MCGPTDEGDKAEVTSKGEERHDNNAAINKAAAGPILGVNSIKSRESRGHDVLPSVASGANSTASIPGSHAVDGSSTETAAAFRKNHSCFHPPTFESIELALEKRDANLKTGVIPGPMAVGMAVEVGALPGNDQSPHMKKQKSASAILPYLDASVTSGYVDQNDQQESPNVTAPAPRASGKPGAFPQRGSSTQDAGLSRLEDGSTTGSDDKSNATGPSLAQAVAVEEDNSSDMMEAQPVDKENLAEQAAREEAKQKYNRRVVTGFVSMACLVLVLALSLGLGLSKESGDKNKEVIADRDTPTPTPTPTQSPTRPLPPMDNLEQLYYDLPSSSRESLYYEDSPQYLAWNWLMNHPNITKFEEWRKKQVYAMVCFFYSFEGPMWPEGFGQRWLNVNSSECSWLLTDEELANVERQTVISFGRDAYASEDFPVCNQDGRVQSIILAQLFLPPKAEPLVPPEISLLTSLKLFALFASQTNAKVSDLVVPELIQLPGLELISCQRSGISGTIPKYVAQMTGLRHLVLGANNLIGTVPTEVGLMTSLEYLGLTFMKDFRGKIPTEIGLMTSMTYLSFFRSDLTGSIPTEVALLTNISWLSLGDNSFTGSLPTELGLLTRATNLLLWGSQFSGLLPTELGLLSNVESLTLNNNAFSGSIPSELGLMTAATTMHLGNDPKHDGSSNDFSGTFPSELWHLSNVEILRLDGLPILSAEVPSNISMPNLTELFLSGSPQISGTLPASFCSIEALEFDCSDKLCGCDCQCLGNETNSSTLQIP